jgi:hypothetical protein
MNTISYIEPLERAFGGMKRRLFRPFDFGKWFTIGFTAWLAMLGKNGGGFNFRFPSGHHHSHTDGVSQFVLSHLVLVTGVVVFTLFLGILLNWIRARGIFMFLDNVIHGRARVEGLWDEFRREGNSLFWWLFAFTWACLFAMLLIIGIGVRLAWPAFKHHCFDVHAVAAIAVMIPLFVTFALVTGGVAVLLEDFVVPLMWKHRLSTNEAWRLLSRITAGRALNVVIYILLRIVLAVAVGALVGAFGLFTCCCGFVLLAVPVVNATLMLPVTVSLRLFALEFLRQFGADADCLVAVPPDLPPVSIAQSAPPL